MAKKYHLTFEIFCGQMLSYLRGKEGEGEKQKHEEEKPKFPFFAMLLKKPTRPLFGA